MSAQVTINPLITTNAAGSFAVKSAGYIQGVAMQDPNVRNQLAGGVLGPNETVPMWGGVLVSETTAPVASSGLYPEGSLGGYVTRATSYDGVLDATAGAATGFSVFDQNHAAINSPQSQVPLTPSGGLVNFYRFGSNARVPVACSSELVDLDGNIITQAVSWDYVTQELIPYEAGFSNTTITGAVWASTAGGQTTYAVSSDLTSDLSTGDLIEVIGVVNTGGTSIGAFNGQWEVVSLTSSHIVVSAPAAASLGTYSSGGTVLGQGGALPVRVLKVEIGNSMTVAYAAATGFAQWNRSGSCALLLI